MKTPLNSRNPIARHNGLVIQELAGEVLVYDMNTNRAHCLNQSASLVWKLCDGLNSVSEIAQQFEGHGLGKVTEDFVWLAIDQFDGTDLLVKKVARRFPGQSRRKVLKTIGLASVIALPFVASLVAPRQALGVDSCVCTNNAQCSLPGCLGNVCNNLGICVQNTPSPKKGKIA